MRSYDVIKREYILTQEEAMAIVCDLEEKKESMTIESSDFIEKVKEEIEEIEEFEKIEEIFENKEELEENDEGDKQVE